ncbi:MAG: hypothetical protein K2Y37_20910 [Pirellulales bacterium]|nr:hypothetical protein [Pirellulales bacterium]
MTTTKRKLVVRTGRRLTSGRLYLRLYHGRSDPNQQMEDWGFNGPTFGPLSSVVMTYLSTIRIHGMRANDEHWLETSDGMVLWQGNYYGDFEVFAAGPYDFA